MCSITSNYCRNAAQLVVLKQFSSGLNFNVSYTISKQIDQTDLANPESVTLERVIAAWDIPQSLQINSSTSCPSARASRWARICRSRCGGSPAAGR